MLEFLAVTVFFVVWLSVGLTKARNAARNDSLNRIRHPFA